MASACLLHPQVNVNYSEVQERIHAGQYRPGTNDQVLSPMKFISDIWERPRDDDLHVFVSIADRWPRLSTHSVSQSALPCEYYPYPYSLHSHWHQRTHVCEARRSQHSTKGSRCTPLSWYCYGVWLFSTTLSETLQVRGTPTSGKTCLAQLLRDYIREQEPAVDIIVVFAWPQEKVDKYCGWEQVFQKKIGLGTRQENCLHLR
jgi:hypothetical protein